MEVDALQKVVSDSIKYPTFYTDTISMAERIGHRLNLSGYYSILAIQNVIMTYTVTGNKEQDSKKLAERIKIAIYG